jgi:hypothetical protein
MLTLQWRQDRRYRRICRNQGLFRLIYSIIRYRNVVLSSNHPNILNTKSTQRSVIFFPSFVLLLSYGLLSITRLSCMHDF